ncbi:hypothetical protein [Streptomyces sp. V4I2]|uniref:hypothetical protein n=1 Tax=Streptomyces sp. V4I2 TaxID=3042280 RepID=UPI00278A9676|nr:hypothetical protein [Streptomyces sp. V4I2]MDQ1051921.1 hypothetical protein [Streptomyces sp. V4I2]
MESIPLALDGYLSEAPVFSKQDGTACWRLNCSPTAELVDDMTIPCTSQNPDVINALVTECRPGDFLRVTGHLALPDSADGGLQLQATTLEILWEAPELDIPEDDTDTDIARPETNRNTAIEALAEALTSLAGQPGPDASIRIHISPTGALGTGLEHCHTIDITPARAHQLADQADAMNCHPDTGTVLDPQTVSELAKVFEDIDLAGLTGAVLNSTRPEHRPKVTRAIDDMFGDVPGPDDPE